MLARLLPDRFLLWLLATLILAVRFPVTGAAAVAIDRATLTAIFALFLLHGARLSREALVGGLVAWRLHLAILAVTFVLFPVLGFGLAKLLPFLLAPELLAGILFLCILPSTVQSSIAFTSMAGGHVAAAVAAAALSNLLGVFLTPLLASLLLEAAGAAAFSIDALARIFGLIFLPFLVGHALRRWILPLTARTPALATLVDKGTILLAVYGAFSAATIEGLWTRLPPSQLGLLVLLLTLLLALVLGCAAWIGRTAGLSAPDRTALLFCGAVKSLASGAAMARILFPGAAAGAILVPVMIFHTIQLLVCAWIAGSIGRRISRSTAPGPGQAA